MDKMRYKIKSLLVYIFLFNNFCISSQISDTIIKDTLSSWKLTSLYSLSGTQSSFVNWNSGGRNNISLIGSISASAIYNKEKWNWSSDLALSFGGIKYFDDANGINLQKTDDKIDISSIIGMRISKKFLVSINAGFKTQFADGFTYPNDSRDFKTEISDNVITIGAMSANYNENLPANFSNYGKINVDVFAPGVQIYSTTPENEYKKLSGTSMAAPSTAGVAALVRSYYPKLTASQVKHILMNSGTLIMMEVIKPGSQSRENPDGEKVPFTELSVSGRVVNAYNALLMADKMVNRKK